MSSSLVGTSLRNCCERCVRRRPFYLRVGMMVDMVVSPVIAAASDPVSGDINVSCVVRPFIFISVADQVAGHLAASERLCGFGSVRFSAAVFHVVFRLRVVR